MGEKGSFSFFSSLLIAPGPWKLSFFFFFLIQDPCLFRNESFLASKWHVIFWRTFNRDWRQRGSIIWEQPALGIERHLPSLLISYQHPERHLTCPGCCVPTVLPMTLLTSEVLTDFPGAISIDKKDERIKQSNSKLQHVSLGTWGQCSK